MPADKKVVAEWQRRISEYERVIGMFEKIRDDVRSRRKGATDSVMMMIDERLEANDRAMKSMLLGLKSARDELKRATDENPLVLIVDDDPDDLFFMRRTVHRAGLSNVLIYDIPDDALHYLTEAAAGHQTVPAAVLSDIKMPGMTGFDFLTQVRAIPELRALRVAMVSGSNLKEDIERARKLGANGYFTKFPNPTDLASFVHGEADLNPWTASKPDDRLQRST